MKKTFVIRTRRYFAFRCSIRRADLNVRDFSHELFLHTSGYNECCNAHWSPQWAQDRAHCWVAKISR